MGIQTTKYEAESPIHEPSVYCCCCHGMEWSIWVDLNTASYPRPRQRLMKPLGQH